MKLIEINAQSIAKYGEQSCAMESLFSKALALDADQKMAMLREGLGLFLINASPGIVGENLGVGGMVWQEHGSSLIGESIGALVDSALTLDDEIPDLGSYCGKKAFYVYSTSISRLYQGAGWSKILRYAMQGYIMGLRFAFQGGPGYDYILGHAREGAMLHIVEQMGARIVRSHDNYFNAGYTAYFYEFDLSGNKTDD